VFIAVGEQIMAGLQLGIVRGTADVLREMDAIMRELNAGAIVDVAVSPAGAGRGAPSTIINNSYYLTANYRRVESEASLRDTLRLVQLMGV
jgi:hypothetical protein